MPLQMLHFSDLQRLPVPKQFFAFSDAYLDSAESLCDALCTASKSATYAHGAAVMSLTFHSIELFLKAAILQKAPSEQFSGSGGHDLGQLYERYTHLNPDEGYAFDFPFKLEVRVTLKNLEGLDPRIADEIFASVQKGKKETPGDQLYRYPTNIKGQSWRVLLGFEPHSFRPVLNQIKSDFKRIRGQMERV